jgi:AIG1 family
MQLLPETDSGKLTGIATTPLASVLPVAFLLIGLTGEGKTSFINTLAGANLRLSHSAHAATSTTTKTLCQIDGVDVEFVDTPGFNSASASDVTVLLDITNWIKNHYGSSRRIVAALYLFSIQNARVTPSEFRTLRLFRELIGDGNMSNVGLVSTNWNSTAADTAELREGWLKEEYWAEMVKGGATTYRCGNDFESGYRIVKEFLQREPVQLKIQEEMTDGKSLNDTDAGKEVCRQLTDAMREKEDIAKELQMFGEPAPETESSADELDPLRNDLAKLKIRLEHLEEENAVLSKPIPFRDSFIGNVTQIAGEIVKITAPLLYDAWKYSQEKKKEERAATNERNMSLIVKGMDIVTQFASAMSS